MKCPCCGGEMKGDAVHGCPACGLIAPLDVLEKLAARLAAYAPRERNEGRVCGLCKADMAMPGSRMSHDCPVPLRTEIERLKSPAVVLAEAERLLRDRQVFEVHLVDVVSVGEHVKHEASLLSRLCDTSDKTLAAAWARVKGADHG